LASIQFTVNTGFGKPNTIHFDSMLVTASDSKPGAIQLRDADEVDKENGIAVVLDKYTLEDSLESELRRLGYSSGKVDEHVSNFIRGLFGKGGMMLFGCGNAWKIIFDSKDKSPSILNLKHSKGSIPVPGRGKTLEKE
jgi:hypothetical protein